ncbi:MAG: DUF6351 family protein [Oleiphilaceae bacterium]|nr:DUF6351 family protein [Oleiphilaceae bacterium]
MTRFNQWLIAGLAVLLLAGCEDIVSSGSETPGDGNAATEVSARPDRAGPPENPGRPGDRDDPEKPVEDTQPLGQPITLDFHTQRSAPLGEGEFDLVTLSGLPDTITGGDVLVGVRGLSESDQLRVWRNGEDVSEVFARDNQGQWKGLVTGLEEGENRLSALASGEAGERLAELDLVNHPITGPVISGPHQSPFLCRTEQAGLGEPLDENCSAETTYEWYYRSADQTFQPLEDPYAPYPDDALHTTTSDGKNVPWVVRLETSTINRGIARLAVLDDPAARGPEAPFEPASWNRRMYYVYGESCGVGYNQGRSSPALVMGGFPNPQELGGDNLLITLAGVSDRLGSGDLVVHNTLTSFGVHCNPMISMETTMMMREHATEHYGVVRQTVGTNGSGAALQQYNAANNAPGLLSAGLPTATFADIPSTAMTVADCGLLQDYYRRNEGELNQLQQARINGHNLLSGNEANAICSSWEDTFLDRLDPTSGCGGVPSSQRYHPETNPDGVRCTIQDANVNIFGTDPETGFARRPLDNQGVQYGLQAFNDGIIDFDQFLNLNAEVGGFDIDGRIVPERMEMDPEVEAISYRMGLVIGRGALAETPFIDVAPYLDLVPIANIHEAVRPFTIRERLRPRAGGGATQSIFRGVLTQPDVFPLMDEWLERIEAAERPFGADPVRTVIDSKPFMAQDRCSFGTVGGRLALPGTLLLPLGGEAPLLPSLAAIAPLPGVDLLSETLVGNDISLRVDVPEDFDLGLGPCSLALPVTSTPRMVAGMPPSGDVLRCQLKPVDAGDYRQSLSREQLAELEAVFPKGVCDYRRPAAFDVHKSMIWPSLGNGSESIEPFELQWRASRSVSL